MTRAILFQVSNKGNLLRLYHNIRGTQKVAGEVVHEGWIFKKLITILWTLATISYWLGTLTGIDKLDLHGDEDLMKGDTRMVDNSNEEKNNLGQEKAISAAIVIPTYLRRYGEKLQLLYKAMESALGQCKHDQIVILVDDGSTIRIPLPMLDDPKFFAIRITVNTGPSHARNVGANFALARGAKIICFLDSDAVAQPDWIEEHVRLQKAKPGLYGGWTQSSSRGIIATLHDYIGTLRGPMLPDGSLLYAPTCNLSVHASLWIEFDTSFRTAAFEDVEYCMRQRKRGNTTEFAPHAVVFHTYGESLISLMKQFYRYGQAEPRMTQVHPDYKAWLSKATTNYSRCTV